eukprot:gene12720-2327_t
MADPPTCSSRGGDGKPFLWHRTLEHIQAYQQACDGVRPPISPRPKLEEHLNHPSPGEAAPAQLGGPSPRPCANTAAFEPPSSSPSTPAAPPGPFDAASTVGTSPTPAAARLTPEEVKNIILDPSMHVFRHATTKMSPPGATRTEMQGIAAALSAWPEHMAQKEPL